VYAAALADNQPLLDDVRLCRRRLTIWAECGGLLWLARELDHHRMAGVVPTAATMTSRLTLGYRHVHTTAASPLGPVGLELRGHEFHYSTVTPVGDGLTPAGSGAPVPPAWLDPRLFGSYLHLHLGAAPELASNFVRAALAAPPRHEATG